MSLAGIFRCDNSGLGTLSWEFFKHLDFAKALIVKNGVYRAFPERFPGGRFVHKDRIKKEDIDWLTSGVTSLLAFETPYEYEIFRTAHRKGVQTFLIPMYECYLDRPTVQPSMHICPSALDFDVVGGHKIHLPVPVNRKVLKYRPRQTAKVFLHNAGHGGISGRNGTGELLAAILMIKSDVKIIINTQKPINYSHPKVEIRVGNFLNYWDLWRDGDVFVFPHKFDGLSLPVQEALSVGMPVLSTDMYPFNTWLPKDWMIPTDEVIKAKPALREIDYHIVKPEAIANKIDEMANRSIVRDSGIANELASKISWDELLPKYKAILK